MSEEIPRAKQRRSAQNMCGVWPGLALDLLEFISLSYRLSPLILCLSTACSQLLNPRIDNSLRVPSRFPLNMLDHKSPLCFSQQEGCLSSKTSRGSAGQVERWGQLNGLSPITCPLLLLRKDFVFLFGPESMDGWGNKFGKLRCHPGLRTIED